MGLFDKAKDAIKGNEKKVADGIDQAADAAKDKVPDEHDGKVDQAADAAKKGLGKLD